MESIRRTARVVIACLAMFPLSGAARAGAQTAADFRPPAVPLVTSDPYLSIWSEADRLTDDVTRHWTHREQPLVSLVRVDGKTFRLMGSAPAALPPLPQLRVRVLPTRSIYEFAGAHVHVRLTFLSPLLPDDLDVLARPLTYLTWDVQSTDGARHRVEIYDSVSSALAVNTPRQQVNWRRESMPGLYALRIGSVEQRALATSGDDTRIDWGFAYLSGPSATAAAAIGASEDLAGRFTAAGTLPARDDTRMPRAVDDQQPVMALAYELGSVGALAVSRHAMIAYDEVYAIKYFGKRLRPFWRRNGAEPRDLLLAAERDYARLTIRSAKFDNELVADLMKVGGERYARICALAYRQCLAGTGIAADANRQPLLFTKENTSNGDIATVDVIFPMAPMLLLVSPTLARASIVPILSYAASKHWTFPNAPHDLGTYPVARGTDDGGEGMPVEESGNMLILCDAIAHAERSAAFVSHWWPKLTQWARYLERYGLDPEEQLCTDDFMGHLAHNANLSIKAILGLAAYGDLCKMRGDLTTAVKYREMARADAAHWTQVAQEDGHSRLAFDRPHSWSQKYNLVWDRILGLDIFPPRIARQEVAYYTSVMNPFGVPLDSRTKLTKTDWSLWTATMAEKQRDFEALVSPIYEYLNRTSARMPLADSYVTDDLRSDGMHARPVVGGIFIKMLADPAMWKKWASRDRFKAAPWAPLPVSPTIVEVVPSSRVTPVLWRYTTEKPGEDWAGMAFDASTWKEGPAGFGTSAPGAIVRTKWNSDDIWIRRVFTMPAGNHSTLQFYVYHDEDVEIYIDGILAGKEAGFTTGYVPIEILPKALAHLRAGATIVLAAHCHQTSGGQNIDIGLADVRQR